MTKINAVECDDCGTVLTETVYKHIRRHDMPNPPVSLYTCEVCGKAICSNCSEDHAKDETQMEWK